MDTVVKYKPAKLFYESYTPEECEDSLSPVIFVHGLGGLHTSWCKVWKRIADQTGRKAFAIDLRNHGKSEWNDVFVLDALVTDIENFAMENDLKQCCLVGHSLGGKVCFRLAMLKPELVDRFVAEETTVRNPYPEEVSTFEVMRTAVRKLRFLPKTMSEKQIRTLLSKYVSQALPGGNYGRDGPLDEMDQLNISLMRRPTDNWGARDSAYNVPLRKNSDGSIGFDFNYDVIDKSMADESAYHINPQTYRTFSGPALFLVFKESPMKLDEDMALKEFFPNAKLQEFSRKAHLLHVECADEYVEYVSTFLNQ